MKKCDHCKQYKDEDAFAWRSGDGKALESGKRPVVIVESFLTKVGMKGMPSSDI